jgi:hypothetical protein
MHLVTTHFEKKMCLNIYFASFIPESDLYFLLSLLMLDWKGNKKSEIALVLFSTH